MAVEGQDELIEALERTGGAALLDRLAGVSKTDEQHCERVGHLTFHAILMMSGDEDLARRGGFAGALHDVGKANPFVQRFITMPRKLSEAEKAAVNRTHTRFGASLIQGLSVERRDEGMKAEAVMAAFYHHSSPRMLQDIGISTNGLTPLIRVVQVADQFDALQDGARAYHGDTPLSKAEATDVISSSFEAVGAFDSVAAFALDVLNEVS